MHYEYKIVCDNIKDFKRLVTKELLEMALEHKKKKILTSAEAGRENQEH